MHLTVPLSATATNKFNDDDHVTDFQVLLDGAVLVFHVIPSEDVKTFVPVPTIRNKLNSGLHIICDQATIVPVLDVQVIPSEDVIIELVVAADCATAANKFKEELQTTLTQL
jgi:hypothetical protein